MRRVLRNPLRAIAVVVSVALATTLLTSVIKACATSVASFEQSLGLEGNESSIFISPVGGRFERQDIARCFSPLSRYADVIGVRRESGIVRAKGIVRSVSIAGVSGFGGEQGSKDSTHDGSHVSSTVRKALRLESDDVITVEVGQRALPIKIQDTSSRLSLFGSVDLLLPLRELGEGFYIDSVLLFPREVNSSIFISSVASFVKSCIGANRTVRLETSQVVIDRREDLLGAYRINIAIMAALTLLVCALLISQATHISIRLQLRELSIARTLGLGQQECFFVIISEAALASFFGGLIGCTIGYPLALWFVSFFINTARDIYQVTLEPFGLGRELVLGLIIILGITLLGALSAAFAARGVLSLAPYRGTRREQVHNHPLCFTRALSAALVSSVVCGGIIILAAVRSGAAVAYASVGAVLLWVACCTPLMIALIMWITKRLNLGIAWTLMRGAVYIAGRHYVLSSMAASLAIALIIGLHLMVSSFHATLTHWSITRLAGDLFVSTALSGDGNEARIDQRYTQTIRENALFKSVIPYFEAESTILGQYVVVAGTDIETQCSRAVYIFQQGGCAGGKETWNGNAIINESAARKLNLPLGSTIYIDGEPLVVRGIVQEFGTERPLVIIDQQNFKDFYPGHNPKTLTIDMVDHGRIQQAREWLANLAPQLLIVRSNAELRDLVDTLFRRTFRVTEGVRWIVFILAVLGVASTGTQYLWERRKEFKTAGVLGVSRWTLTIAVGLEAGCIATAAAVVGLLGGVAVGWCLTAYINPQVFGWSFPFSLSARPLVEAFCFLLCVCILCMVVARQLVARIMQSVRLNDE